MLSLIHGYPLYFFQLNEVVSDSENLCENVHLYNHVVFAVEFTCNSAAEFARYNFKSALVCNPDSLCAVKFFSLCSRKMFF